ncbi:MAG: class I SAM-dependent methyltransferase [Gammaproteobacteria bacterium]|nr:class I SAM-dependent methyltransferase [Gammaproteobacteria bacterium]
MSKPSSQANNITMATGGEYSLATIGAKHVIDNALPMVVRALDQILEESPDRASENNHLTWCFSDMGCADGGTSLDLWRNVLSHLRRRSDADVQVVYADQSRNDFNALVSILHGHSSFKSYLDEYDHVHALESGSSFYLPILPANSLDVGFSATAMHWLSSLPCNISDHVHMVGARGSELESFSHQAAQDWQTILTHRARELRAGGRLVLINFCIDDQGRYLGNTGGVNMFDNFNALWQSFVSDGVITDEEYQAMTLPQYYNTVEEFSEPFEDSNNAVYKKGLRLEEISTAVVACPFAEDFKQHGDAKRFAKEYIPTIRSWNESIYYGALSANRSLEERQEIINAYYAAYQSQVESNPSEHGMGYVHAYMSIRHEV